MGSLFSDLASKPQRETAGSDATTRFDYQKDWAFCQMMRRHIADEGYLVAFEYHDDVLFLSPIEHPASAEFFQVKTSSASNPRKLSSITSRPNGKSSIVGKMFSNFEGICSSHDVRVVLVSNNAFEFADAELCAKNLDERFRIQLLKKLMVEIPGFDETRLEKLHFLVTGVSLEAMQSFLEGEALALFCHKFGEDHGLNIRTWVRLIKSEIARKNNYPSDKVANAADLITKKCIGQPFVENTLNVMHSRAKTPLHLSTMINILEKGGWTTAELLKFEKKIPEASTDFYNPLNEEVKKISAIMRESVHSVTVTPLELGDFIHKVVKKVTDDDSIAAIYKQNDYLRALGALVYYDEI